MNSTTHAGAMARKAEPGARASSCKRRWILESPVISLSANAQPRDIQRVLEATFLRYLMKPTNADVLMKTLDIGLGVPTSRQALHPKVA